MSLVVVKNAPAGAFHELFPFLGDFHPTPREGKWTDGADDGKQENKKLCTEERDATCRQKKRRE